MSAESNGSCYQIITRSPEETKLVGEMLGRLLGNGSVVCLRGELGSGKTCLTQGIGQGMNVCGAIHSPTFVFINEHPPKSSGPCLYHVDLYRVQDLADVLALGLEEYMYGNGVTVIEWADKAGELLPAERLWVTLSHLNDHCRRLKFEAQGSAYLATLLSLREMAASANISVQNCRTLEDATGH